jgi:predicted XRE-type DNA-binding protein
LRCRTNILQKLIHRRNIGESQQQWFMSQISEISPRTRSRKHRQAPEIGTLRAELMARLRDAIAERGLTAQTATQLLRASSTQMSLIMHGRNLLVSANRLLGFLALLGHSVEICVKPAPKNGRGRIAVSSLPGTQQTPPSPTADRTAASDKRGRLQPPLASPERRRTRLLKSLVMLSRPGSGADDPNTRSAEIINVARQLAEIAASPSRQSASAPGPLEQRRVNGVLKKHVRFLIAERRASCSETGSLSAALCIQPSLLDCGLPSIVSTERLLAFLISLDQDVDINISPSAGGKSGCLSVGIYSQ